METPDLLVALTTTLIAAAIGGAVAVRLRQSAVVGYILAGMAIGPRTPGLVADFEIVNALADLGVIFLMFSIGIQISFHEIRRVGALVAVGGTAQVAASVAIGWAIGMALGWSSLEALFLGGLWGVVAIGALLFAVTVWTDRPQVLRWAVRAWVVGGTVFLLFGAINFYTHIGMYYNIEHGTMHKW